MDRTTISLRRTLSRIASVDFQASLGITLNPRALRNLAGATDECRTLRRLYACGLLSDQDLTDFLRELFASFRAGERFPFEGAVICVSVALEGIPADFAQDLLLELANITRSELPLAPRVAKICLLEWLGSKVAVKSKSQIVIENTEFDESDLQMVAPQIFDLGRKQETGYLCID